MIRIFNHYVSKMAFILLMLELVILLSAASLAGALLAPQPYDASMMYRSSVAFALVVLFSMSALGMYQGGARDGIKGTLLRLTPSFVLGFALMHALVALRPELYFGRAAFGRGAIALVFVMAAAGIALTRFVVYRSARSSLLEARLIFVGSGALARECMELARARSGFHRFRVVGCVPVPGEEACVTNALTLEPGETLLALARRHGVTELVVSVANRRNGAYPVRQLLDCALGGVKVIDSATFFEREASQIRVDSLQPSYLIFGGGFDQGFLRAGSKRIFDLVASLVIFFVSWPVMLLAAVCILLEDGGPVFYTQERVGKDNKLFKVLKFRSMRKDAESAGLPTWAAEDDPRITRVGRVIRKLRIDELPQILNVLKGEMSFVGPRPERAYFVEQLVAEVPYYEIRHRIKPGITGLAQVRYQYGASVDDAIEKLQYDLYYVKNNSLFLDLLILLDTVQVVLSGKGSR